MSVLIVLILVQLAGALLSIILFQCFRHSHIRKLHIRFENGTALKRQRGPQWLMKYFLKFPNSNFRQQYPEQRRLAMAVKKYRQICYWKRIGLLSEKRFQRKLEQILPLIEISHDLSMAFGENDKLKD